MTPKILKCHVCGNTFEPYITAKYNEPMVDSVMVRVYDLKTEEFNTKYYRTCRYCAQHIRYYIDKLSRDLKGPIYRKKETIG